MVAKMERLLTLLPNRRCQKKEEEVVEPSPRRGSEGFPHFWQKRQKIDKKSNNLLFLIRVQQIFIGVWRIFCKAVNRRVEYFLAVAR